MGKATIETRLIKMIENINDYEFIQSRIGSKIYGVFPTFRELVSQFSSDKEKSVILLLLIKRDIAKSRSFSYSSPYGYDNYFDYTNLQKCPKIEELIEELGSLNMDLFRREIVKNLMQLSDNFYSSSREEFLQSIAFIVDEESFSEVISNLYKYHKKKSDDFIWTILVEDLNKFSGVVQGKLISTSAQIYEDFDDLLNERNSRKSLREQRKHIIRRRLISLFRNNQDILFAFLEKIIEDFQDIEDELVCVLINSIDEKDINYLKNIASNNGNKNVRLLADIIKANLDGSFAQDLVPLDGFSNISQTVMFYENMIASKGRVHNGRTWLEDEIIEQIIQDAFSKSDQDFSKYYTEQVGKREESLTERFLTRLEDNFEPVKSAIEIWGKKVAKSKVRVKFNYRDVQKQEKDWQADIAFLLNCSIDRKFTRKHGILIQCKQMKFSRLGEFQKKWTIDIEQCRDLVKISPFSYYFFYGPSKYPHINTLVVPATTIEGILDARTKPSQKNKTLSFEDIEPNSRSFADFMLYDFVGCWNGDCSENITEFISGDKGLLPVARFLVELSITKGSNEENI